jgi:hypothetical protein
VVLYVDLVDLLVVLVVDRVAGEPLLEGREPVAAFLRYLSSSFVQEFNNAAFVSSLC